MRRVVVDTSVLVSAFLTPHGTPATLLARARQGAFSLCLSPEILEETARALEKLRGRRRPAPGAVRAYCRGLAQSATLVQDLPEVAAVPRDPKDDHVVACALKAAADYLVTGDDHMLSLGEFQGIRIVTPRDLLAIVER